MSTDFVDPQRLLIFHREMESCMHALKNTITADILILLHIPKSCFFIVNFREYQIIISNNFGCSDEEQHLFVFANELHLKV